MAGRCNCRVIVGELRTNGPCPVHGTNARRESRDEEQRRIGYDAAIADVVAWLDAPEQRKRFVLLGGFAFASFVQDIASGAARGAAGKGAGS